MKITNQETTSGVESTLAPRLWSRRLQEIAAVIAGHFLLTCLFTFPLILNFGSQLPGKLIEDRDQNLWNLWWVRDSLLHFRNPFHTDFIYFPEDTSLYFHTLHPINGVLSLPVQLIFGMTAAYNFVVFYSFILAGLGAYLLLNYLCRNKPAAFAASLIFAYSPYHLGTLKGVMQLISLQWLPFYVLFLLLTARERENRLRNGLLAAIFLLLTALTDWYYTLFLLGFTALYGCWLVIAGLLNKQGRKAFLPILNIGLSLGIFAALVSPILIPMLRELSGSSYYLPDPNDTRKFSADLTQFFLPSTTSSFFGWLSQNFSAQYVTGWLAAQVYPGYVAVILAIVGLYRQGRARFWGFTALIFWILAFGPALRVNGAQPGWWMPYALIENLPVVKIMRSPDRFMVITMLCLAVCAAYGLASLNLRFAVGKKKEWALAGLAGALIVVEFLQIPYPLEGFKYSPFFDQLAKDKEDYSLVEVPAQGGFFTGAERMAEQAIHGKRIFDGYISREYDHPFQQRAPGFRELTTLKFNQDIMLPAADDSSDGTRHAWYDAFHFYKVRYIILRLPQNDKQNATDIAKYRTAIARIAPGAAVYRDDQIEAYALPQLSETRPFVEIGNGWYEPEQTAGTTTYHRWATDTANLFLCWEGVATKNVTLSLSIGLLQGEKSAKITLDDKIIWSDTLKGGLQALKIPLALSPGKHRLDFKVEGEAAKPSELGMGNDTRRLLYLVKNVQLD
ncbi:MAG: hypothetical protein HXX08_21950 [Chloroflexi bacterium]|uniref:Glycosyltransferase RgtA/B/C/D-like domain-containing protein n=1 Tax=Candidatus Chlorohelix allophototropha TaxID=3003348 RepID=A0A8T7M8S0_9CHLR|nr:hypothetical protein [Chloroflexota bacterium]WJW68462.1 hypothetical protein OZ401_004074 [Chloroflexota bacterium L227-S17]